MKRFNIILLAVCALFVASCDYDTYEDENAVTQLENGEKFVRILTGGADGEQTVTVSETTPGLIPVEVENLFAFGEDVTVEYGLGGSAAFGADYTVEGASASGGTVVVNAENDDAEDNSPSTGVIEIELFVDTLVNGPETIIVELLSAATPSNTTINVGQGSLRKTLTINLVND
ncbi:hypothetical protein LEM8419_01143 [Neolewinella maritima]|uniref:DUF4843 domain-containing protein n=1 Tax=Neolewinella maritima TaxID=1383882 RepID=A0ABM9AZP6_9BACT|nr:hypothetical protein [Neolewinella maritima]CAH0999873.1 hypothetical protein LEM8419_01143 [Neolewinella maritima]